MGKPSFSKVQRTLLAVFDRNFVEKTAKTTGFLKRKRKVLPLELFIAVISSCAKGRSGTFAQIWREYCRLTGIDVAYKPFHNQLVKPEFEDFLHTLAVAAMQKLSSPACRAARTSLEKFEDVLVQDGSGFCVHHELSECFPRRFGHWGADAGVEMHATMSLLSDQLTRVSITADSAPERPHLPRPDELKHKLILADRGYQDHAYAVAVKNAGGDVLVRSQTPNPQTVKYWHDGRKCCPANPVFFKRLIEQHPYSNFDLDASYPKRGLSFRTVSLWIEEKHSRITLLTTLERRRFSAEKIGEIYRLRWQIEILFKEMKSHAGLGKWLTRKESLVRATIWSSVIATLLKRYLSHSSVRGGAGCSTLRCAEVLRTEMPQLLDVIGRRKPLGQPLKRLMNYLSSYGVRAHRTRDQTSGRYSCGLAPVS